MLKSHFRLCALAACLLVASYSHAADDVRMQLDAQQRTMLQLQNEMNDLRSEVASLRGQLDELRYTMQQQQSAAVQSQSAAAAGVTAQAQQGAPAAPGTVAQGPAPATAAQSAAPAAAATVTTAAGAAAATTAASSQSSAAAAAPAAAQPDATAKAAYDKAYSYITANNFAEASKAFAAYVQQYPDNALTPNAWYWLGQVQYRQGQLDDARVSFLNVARFNSSNKRPDALYKLGLVCKQKGDKDKAVRYFNLVVSTYPADTAAAMARKELAELQK